MPSFRQISLLRRMLSGRRTAFLSHWNFHSGFGFIDLIIPGLHKANGISRLLKRWDLSPQNVVAIGDSGNDAEMLKMARYSFAMGNAAENIKQIARYATDDNNHEGALNVIQAVLDNTSPFNS